MKFEDIYKIRGEILYKLGDYESSLRDVNRIIKIKNDDSIKDFQNQILSSQKKLKNPKPNTKIPQRSLQSNPEPLHIQDRHPVYTSASNALNFTENRERGRHVIAARNIQPGNTISFISLYWFEVFIRLNIFSFKF